MQTPAKALQANNLVGWDFDIVVRAMHDTTVSQVFGISKILYCQPEFAELR